MSRRRNTRYPHVFSKGKGPGSHSEGSWRGARFAAERAAREADAAKAAGNPATSPACGGGGPSAEEPMVARARSTPMKPSPYPMKLDPRRWKYLKVSPTIANLYRGHLGVAVICADCLHGVAHRNPGLPDHFRRQWHLTLIELEKRCRCEMCGSRNARVYPWWGDNGEGALGLEGPPGGG